MSDPIRDALRAAQDEALRFLWEAEGHPAYELTPERIERIREYGDSSGWNHKTSCVPSAIAAFLRALPDRIQRTQHFTGGASVATWVDLTHVKEMASAVEEAARDA